MEADKRKRAISMHAYTFTSRSREGSPFCTALATDVYSDVCVCMCIYIYVYIYVYIYICTNICTYIYTYLYIHTAYIYLRPGVDDES